MSRKPNLKRNSVVNLDYANLEDRKVLDAATCERVAGLDCGLQPEMNCTIYVPESLPDFGDGGTTNDLPPSESPRKPFDPEPEIDGLRKEVEETVIDWEASGLGTYIHRTTRYFDADNQLRRQVYEYGSPGREVNWVRTVTNFKAGGTINGLASTIDSLAPPGDEPRNPFDAEPDIEGLKKSEWEYGGLGYRLRETYYLDANDQVWRKVTENGNGDRWIEDFDTSSSIQKDSPVTWWDRGADGLIDSMIEPILDPPVDEYRQPYDPEPELDGLRKETSEMSVDLDQDAVFDFRSRSTYYFDANNRLLREVNEDNVCRRVTDYNYLDENTTYALTWSDSGWFSFAVSQFVIAPSNNQNLLPELEAGGITNDLPPISITVDPIPVDPNTIDPNPVDPDPGAPLNELPNGCIPGLLFEIEEYEQILGMTQEQANAWANEKQVKFRLNKLDGEDLFVTMDYIVGRINVHVEQGIVIGVGVEGTLILLSMNAPRVGISPTVVSPIDNPQVVVDVTPNLDRSPTNSAKTELDTLRFVGFADSNGKAASSVKSNSDSRRASTPTASSQTLARSALDFRSNFASTDLLFEEMDAKTMNSWLLLDQESDSPRKFKHSDLDSVFEQLESLAKV